jgi:hypothetical protein
MLRFLPAALVVLMLAVPAGAPAGTAVAGQMNISTGARLFDDTSLVQYAAPRTVRTKIDGRERTVGMSVNTLCCRTDAQLLRDTGEYGGAAVMLDRPLTAAEKLRFNGRLVWIDGDVLVAQPDNPRCTTGMSLSHVRTLLEHPIPSGQRVYAPASPYDGAREVLFGITAKDTNGPAYGKGVRIVNEQSSIAAVASDPDALAAVAWSAARAAIKAGAVCEIPINGITASETTLRDRTYPVTLDATLVVSRSHPFGAPWIRHWYLDEYLPSAKTRKLLTTADGRNRLLP